MKTENGEYFAVYFGLVRFWLYQCEIMEIPTVPTNFSKKLGDLLKM